MFEEREREIKAKNEKSHKQERKKETHVEIQ